MRRNIFGRSSLERLHSKVQKVLAQRPHACILTAAQPTALQGGCASAWHLCLLVFTRSAQVQWMSMCQFKGHAFSSVSVRSTMVSR